MSFTKKINWQGVPSKREKIIFGLVCLLILFAFIKTCSDGNKVVGVVKKDLKEIIADKKSLSQSLSQIEGRRKTGIKRGTKRTAIFEEWAIKVVDAPDVFIMREFTSPVLLRDLKMQTVSFGDTVREAGVVQQPFHIVLNGSFVSTNKYLKRLYKLPLLLLVDTIEVKLDNTGSGRVDTDIKGDVYGWK